MTPNDLGVFLKARRDRMTPTEVGLLSHGQRRVTGLRREEVSMLAGVSVDYYTRLEQGRERNPSPSVLNAIAGALDLDDDARGHLFRVAGLGPALARGSSDGDHRIDPSLARLLESWPQTPAIVVNRRLDILGCNGLARALYADFAAVDNLVRMTFVDPAGPVFFADWDRASRTCVANLRLALGFAVGEASARALVAEAHAASAEFRTLWRDPEVRGKTHEAKTFHHSQVGELVLDYHAFEVRSAPGQQLVAYGAESGTPSAEKLQLLGSLGATAQAAPPAPPHL